MHDQQTRISVFSFIVSVQRYARKARYAPRITNSCATGRVRTISAHNRFLHRTFASRIGFRACTVATRLRRAEIRIDQMLIIVVRFHAPPRRNTARSKAPKRTLRIPRKRHNIRTALIAFSATHKFAIRHALFFLIDPTGKESCTVLAFRADLFRQDIAFGGRFIIASIPDILVWGAFFPSVRNTSI